MLTDLRAGLGGPSREPPHPARGLQRRVGGVEDRRAEAAVERLLDPVGGEAVGTQRLVLDGELVTFILWARTEEQRAHASQVSRFGACGGLWDADSGGFFRYANGSDWTLPGTGKTLEDNAALLHV